MAFNYSVWPRGLKPTIPLLLFIIFILAILVLVLGIVEVLLDISVADIEPGGGATSTCVFFYADTLPTLSTIITLTELILFCFGMLMPLWAWVWGTIASIGWIVELAFWGTKYDSYCGKGPLLQAYQAHQNQLSGKEFYGVIPVGDYARRLILGGIVVFLYIIYAICGFVAWRRNRQPRSTRTSRRTSYDEKESAAGRDLMDQDARRTRSLDV